MSDNRKVYEDLVLQLKKLGYYGHQIRDLLKSSIGKDNLDSMNEEDYENAIEILQSQINFAKKCITRLD